MPLHLEEGAPNDFDFIIGSWSVRHRKLNARLANCEEWTEFAGLSSTMKTLGGFGNLEDNILHLPEGTYRAVAMRSYDEKSGLWSIWWLDGRNPTVVDTPVRGRFENGVGTFYADDVFNGQPIRIRFIWKSPKDGKNPTWEQAFSPDGGESWETNWRMEFTAQSI